MRSIDRHATVQPRDARSLRRSDLFSRQATPMPLGVGVSTHLDGGGQFFSCDRGARSTPVRHDIGNTEPRNQDRWTLGCLPLAKRRPTSVDRGKITDTRRPTTIAQPWPRDAGLVTKCSPPPQMMNQLPGSRLTWRSADRTRCCDFPRGVPILRLACSKLRCPTRGKREWGEKPQRPTPL
jgi:hypothetical protein